jgi:hypothetical protein
MTFSSRETSLFTGEPLRVVVIRRGSLVWRYAVGDRELEVDGQTFPAPGGVSYSEIRDSSQRAKNRITITLPIDLPVADNWLPYPTAGTVLVACLAKHRGETDYTVEWTGRVMGPKFSDTRIELICEPSRSVTKSRGNNLRWQRGCPVAVYSQGIGMCNADPELHKVTTAYDDKDGLSIEASAFGALPAGRLAGGFLRWLRPDGEPDYRTIMTHVGSVITIDYDTDAMEPATSLDAFPGCKHDWEDCGYFSNQDNYAGCRYIPIKTPHDGNPVQ